MRSWLKLAFQRANRSPSRAHYSIGAMIVEIVYRMKNKGIIILYYLQRIAVVAKLHVSNNKTCCFVRLPHVFQ